MTRRIISMAVLAVSLLLSGCGYQVGRLGHPQIKSIAVAEVTNDTLHVNLGSIAREVLCEIITTDGTYKLTHLSTADCILYARVLSAEFSEINRSKVTGQDYFTPYKWRAKITLEYTVMIPGRAEPLISIRKITGESTFAAGPDVSIGQDSGLRQAMLDAGKSVIYDFAESW